MANSIYETGALESDTKKVNAFWFGFFVYISSYVLSTTGTVNYIVCQLIQSAGVIVMITNSVFLIKIKFENNYFRVIYVAYCAWTLGVLFRSVTVGYDVIKVGLMDANYGLFPYFVPLIALFPQSLVFFKTLFRVIIALNIIYLLYDVVFVKTLLSSDQGSSLSQGVLENFARYLSLPSGFILFTYSYHKKKVNVLAFVAILSTLFFAIIRARRGLILMTLIIFVIFGLIYVFNERKTLLLIFPVLLSFFLTFSLSGMNFFPADSKMFRFLAERGMEDTRTNVEECFYFDLTEKDWIVGKGMQGEYYCPGIDEDNVTGYRSVIETDYLQIILKGGVISLILWLLICIPAIIQGLFFSQNLLAKASALWILFWVSCLYPTSVVNFSLSYLLFWICIGICYSTNLRSETDLRIRNALKRVSCES